MSTADKLLTALSLFTFEEPEWTVEAAADAMQTSGSTAYRYFNSLIKAGLLDSPVAGRYVLGPAIIAFDRQIRLLDPLIKVARPAIERLIQRNGGTGIGILCRRFGQQVMCVYQRNEHVSELSVGYERGRPMGPYRGANSLVILANLPGRTRRTLYNEDSVAIAAAGLAASWEEFRTKLRTIRSSGVWTTHGEVEHGMIGIAAPIYQAGGQVIGSIGIGLSEEDSCDIEVAGGVALVQAAAREINAGLGR